MVGPWFVIVVWMKAEWQPVASNVQEVNNAIPMRLMIRTGGAAEMGDAGSSAALS
jgi:hypothetical protein